MERDRSILFSIAAWTETRCSATFPMMGTIIMPTKNGVRPRVSVTASTDATSNSLIRAMPAMARPMTARDLPELQACTGRASLTVTASHFSRVQLLRV